jgi:inhibitor of cysteine peptidase
MVLVYAQDTSLIDAVEQYIDQEKTSDPTQFTMQEFSSCDDLTSVLTKYLKDNADYFTRSGPIMMPFARGGMMEDSSAISSKAMVADGLGGWGEMWWWAPVASTSTEFSQTNNQIAGVDEPDVFKTDWRYRYYVNERTRTIQILQSPLDRASATIDVTKLGLVNELVIPQNLYQTQLFLDQNRMVVVSSRWRDFPSKGWFLDINTRVTVMVFDMTDPRSPKFLSLRDLPGQYHDARLVNGELMLVQQMYPDRYRGYQMRDKTTPEMHEIVPATIEVARSATPTRINNKDLPIMITKTRPACEAISYALPDSATLQEYGLQPNFTIISKIPVQSAASPTKTAITIGTTSQIHATVDTLYLTQWLYQSRAIACPFGARCVMPQWSMGQYSLIHKFDLTQNPSYLATNMVSGSPLSQYSMSQDAQGNFRILTSQRDHNARNGWQTSTNLFILDKNLAPLGSLTNIEPGESFQSSRYIDDKLYLVTFEQIDPLFVIDLADVRKPRILWELKIPWYSTYLHPWWTKTDGVQHLIGLGYDTVESPRWWWGIVNGGIKVDLYTIDYNQVDAQWNISVKQTATQTYGDMESNTEATYNPRVFVRDTTKKQLILPLSLTKSQITQQCTLQYDMQGNELPDLKQCYPNVVTDTTFAGMKVISMHPTTGIRETYSADYRDRFLKDEVYFGTTDVNAPAPKVYPRQYSGYMPRVGYAGDLYFSINQLFAHAVVQSGAQEQYIDLQWDK